MTDTEQQQAADHYANLVLRGWSRTDADYSKVELAASSHAALIRTTGRHLAPEPFKKQFRLLKAQLTQAVKRMGRLPLYRNVKSYLSRWEDDIDSINDLSALVQLVLRMTMILPPLNPAPSPFDDPFAD